MMARGWALVIKGLDKKPIAYNIIDFKHYTRHSSAYYSCNFVAVNNLVFVTNCQIKVKK